LPARFTAQPMLAKSAIGRFSTAIWRAPVSAWFASPTKWCGQSTQSAAREAMSARALRLAAHGFGLTPTRPASPRCRTLPLPRLSVSSMTWRSMSRQTRQGCFRLRQAFPALSWLARVQHRQPNRLSMASTVEGPSGRLSASGNKPRQTGGGATFPAQPKSPPCRRCKRSNVP